MRTIRIAVALVVILGLMMATRAQEADDVADDRPFIKVLGIAQDAGYPHIGCKRECCQPAWTNPALRRLVTCLALVDPASRQRWLFECTPDFPSQLRLLDERFPVDKAPGLEGILLTHAHIGHYAGLMHLGREALGARDVVVYAMPRMRHFLTNEGPWSQLVALRNIRLAELEAGRELPLNERLTVKPLLVPHRDEFSETVGFVISGPVKRVLFIPDIDKWERWDTRIESLLETVDVAFLDGTFYRQDELPGRDMSEIPHPFIQESLQRFAELPAEEKKKIRFIHLNHSNPALPEGAIRRRIDEIGFGVAIQGEEYGL